MSLVDRSDTLLSWETILEQSYGDISADLHRLWSRCFGCFARNTTAYRSLSSSHLSRHPQHTGSTSCVHLLVPNVGPPPFAFTSIFSFRHLLAVSWCGSADLCRCYLITHAHLDHCLSLILLSGSVPPRPTLVDSTQPNSPALNSNPFSSSAKHSMAPPPPSLPRTPVYATKETLQRLALVFGGDLWPELGTWAPSKSSTGTRTNANYDQEYDKEEGADGEVGRKKRKVDQNAVEDNGRRAGLVGSISGDSDQMGSGGGTGIVFTP